MNVLRISKEESNRGPPGWRFSIPGGFIITPLRSKMRYDKKITDFFSAGKILTAKKSVLSVLYSPLLLLYHSKRELSNYFLPGSAKRAAKPSAATFEGIAFKASLSVKLTLRAARKARDGCQSESFHLSAVDKRQLLGDPRQRVLKQTLYRCGANDFPPQQTAGRFGDGVIIEGGQVRQV